MGEVILKYLEVNNGYLLESEIKKGLKIRGEEQTIAFLDALNVLVEDGMVFFDTKKGYRLFKNELGVAFGEIEINKAGNGFVHTNDGYTIFIPHEDLNGALHGDRVIVGSIDIGKKDDFRGVIYRIVKRKTGNIIFEVVGNGIDAKLVPYDKNQSVNVSIPNNQLRKLVDGELILVNVNTKKIHGEFIGEIDQVIGHKNDAGMDLKLIYMQRGVPIEFSDEALKEAEELPIEVFDEELEGRVDLRDKCIVTIDCDDTKDRDDAVYVEKLENGHYKLYTSISHISHYIKKSSSLYKEASIRNTSHYPNNTCNPMFPHKVSNGICSLNENVDRLTRTCEMEFDSFGNVVDYSIYPSVICSRKAMSYSNVNRILEGEMVDGYEEYLEQIQFMKELSDLLEKAREKRNCLDFDTLDVKVIQNKNGEIEGIAESSNGKAGRIIENFMLITGTTVAEHYSWIPFIYRIHEAPDEEVVHDVIQLLRTSGFDIPNYQNVDEMTIKKILDKVGTSEEASIVKTVLLKSMKRARYDVNNEGHFALQLKNYCHFTSPIRRFTDFRIHTLLDELDTMDYTPETIKKLEQELIDVAKNASQMERIAQEIEIEAMNMAMAEYMEHHIGEEYLAMVTEVYEHGMFAKTDEHISGKISFEDMEDDRYFYYPEKRAIIGKKHKKKYQIGNKIYVVVKDACRENRTINFKTGKKRVLKKDE